MAIEPYSTGFGVMRRLIASMVTKMAEPMIRPAWPKAAKGSALPWPKRCSVSAGTSAWRTASSVTTEAAPSSKESTRLESRLTESESHQPTSLTATKVQAVVTEA